MQMRPESRLKNRVVNIKFKADCSKQLIEKQVAALKQFIQPNSTEWGFYFKSYGLSNCKILFPLIDKFLINSLTLHFCKAKKIIFKIIDIQFSRLQTLSLPGNNIQSIEVLQVITAPDLSFIELRANNITNVSSLKKCYNFMNLKFLSIEEENKIIDYNDLYQFPILSIKDNKMEKLYVGYQQMSNTEQIFKIIGNNNLFCHYYLQRYHFNVPFQTSRTRREFISYAQTR